MKLAEISNIEKGRLRIPEAFGRVLGLYDDSELFCCHLRDATRPEMILTTIPPRSWRTIRRIAVRLLHRAGQLFSVAKILSENGVNILLMEGYGYYSPEEQGWWSAVIDFPELHGEKDDAVIQKKIVDLIGELSILFPGAKIYDRSQESYASEPVDLAGSGLLWSDATLCVWIGPMQLQKYVGQIVEVAEVPAYVVHRNAIKILVSRQGMGSRNLFMCNTEEKFIRVGRIESPAEIELEVHTRGGAAKVGVGILSEITRILREFKPPFVIDEAKGFNIAFTYNYRTVYKEPDAKGEGPGAKSEFSEASKIKFFLELPNALWNSRENEQRRVWRALFRELLRARRANEDSFVNGKGSSLVIWQRRIEEFRGNGRGEVVAKHCVRRASDWLMKTSRRKRAAVFAAALLLLVSYLMFGSKIEMLRPLREPLVGFTVASLAFMIFPKISED